MNSQDPNARPMPNMGIDPSMANSAQMNIVKKMGMQQGADQGQQPGGPQKDTGVMSVTLLTSAIQALNKYADMIAPTDDANSRAARLVISVLGEMLKTAHHSSIMQNPTQGIPPEAQQPL